MPDRYRPTRGDVVVVVVCMTSCTLLLLLGLLWYDVIGMQRVLHLVLLLSVCTLSKLIESIDIATVTATG